MAALAVEAVGVFQVVLHIKEAVILFFSEALPVPSEVTESQDDFLCFEEVILWKRRRKNTTGIILIDTLLPIIATLGVSGVVNPL